MGDKDVYKNPVLQLRISPELEERLNRVAVMYGVSRGEIARIAIAQYCGQITGVMDQMVNKVVSEQKFDVEKMIELMMPKMVESFKEIEKV